MIRLGLATAYRLSRYTCAIREVWLFSFNNPQICLLLNRSPVHRWHDRCDKDLGQFTIRNKIHSFGPNVELHQHFGTPTEEEKRAYTRVLQGHIAIDTLVFPNGTTGE